MTILRTWGPWIIGVILVATMTFGGFRYYTLSKELQTAKSDLASTTASFASQTQQQADALTNEQSKNAQLEAQLTQLNNSFGTQINSLSTTVGTLSKLASTDPELLEKYSKVFFLSENYVPAKLSNIDPSYVYGKNTLQFQSDALPFLTAMIDASRASGADLSVISAYRSFGTQAILKSSYKITYGKGTANSFSADQGYSEHQLGTAVDLTTNTVKDSFVGFEKTSANTWLIANAYKYGFILSYPAGNAYYAYEPWHWRFVGVKLATMLHAENESFYNLDQRTISAYLISIFDPIQMQ